jgi:hypothetical protein
LAAVQQLWCRVPQIIGRGGIAAENGVTHMD